MEWQGLLFTYWPATSRLKSVKRNGHNVVLDVVTLSLVLVSIRER